MAPDVDCVQVVQCTLEKCRYLRIKIYKSNSMIDCTYDMAVY